MKSLANALLVSSCAAARVGPKSGGRLGREPIGDAAAERRFGADDGQVDAFAIDERERRRRCRVASTGAIGDVAGDAGVAGRADDVVDAGFVAELPGQGVLARAGAEDENSHAGYLGRDLQ